MTITVSKIVLNVMTGRNVQSEEGEMWQAKKWIWCLYCAGVKLSDLSLIPDNTSFGQT